MLKTPEKTDLAKSGRQAAPLLAGDQASTFNDTVTGAASGHRPTKNAGTLTSLLRLCSSLTAILLALLATIYVGIYYGYPWKDLASMELPRWIIKFAEGVPNYVRSTEYKPLLVFGSSLIIAPSSRLNNMHFSAPDEYGYRTPTPGAEIYQAAIKNISGRTPSIKILAVPGSVVSDQVLILRELIAAGKAPKGLVFTLAPRDFIDNEVGNKINDTATARVLAFVSHSKNFLPKSLAPADIESGLSSHRTYFDLVRKHFGRSLRDKVCTWSGHPKDLWGAAMIRQGAGQKAEPGSGKAAEPKAVSSESQEQTINADALNAAATARDLALYKKRYQPPNQANFETQVGALDQLLTIAKEAHIATLLVEMPLAKENLALLQPAQKIMLESNIKRLATKYDVEFVDYNKGPQPIFQSDDFYDSVHLDKKGATKFVPLFSQTISHSRIFGNTFQ